MLRHSTRLSALALCIAASTAAAQQVKQQGHANTLSPAEEKDGWTLLFDGSTTNGWRGYKQQSVPAAWHVDNGTLTKTTGTTDLISTQKYTNFDLQLDWKLARKGNAGIFYRGTEEYDHIYWSGPEYQLLDDKGHEDGKRRLTAAGSAYAVYPSPKGYLHPAGQWNHTRLVVNGNHVEHWLNGHKVVEYELGSPDWQKRVAASKFKDWPNYGKASSGYIGIQGDHDGALALRNIKIKVLP